MRRLNMVSAREAGGMFGILGHVRVLMSKRHSHQFLSTAFPAKRFIVPGLYSPFSKSALFSPCELLLAPRELRAPDRSGDSRSTTQKITVNHEKQRRKLKEERMETKNVCLIEHVR